ncbi:hypothetical protein F5146DRAFT_1228642 [Armillaria mellea]|nr:hypothetical protein F5146DRAFT_1228642 [Armillaria mellea]
MFFTSTFTLLLTAIINFSAAQEKCARNYTIVAGDTCESIMKSQGVTRFQLYWVNPWVDLKADLGFDQDCDSVGQVLCLGVVGQDCDETYIVKSGDTCTSIAKAMGVKLDIFKRNQGYDVNCPYVDTYYPVVCVATEYMGYQCPPEIRSKPDLFVQDLSG